MTDIDYKARHDHMSRRLFICNGCGGSWNCNPMGKDEHGHTQPEIDCPYCERDHARTIAARLADAYDMGADPLEPDLILAREWIGKRCTCWPERDAWGKYRHEWSCALCEEETCH